MVLHANGATFHRGPGSSPTKTPEYLAAGKPVVSTSIREVVRPYRDQGLVRIADDPDAFVHAVEDALRDDMDQRMPDYDRFLAQTSWDKTWRTMEDAIDRSVVANRSANLAGEAGAV